MTWQLNAVLNGVIGLAYLAISWTIVRGLRQAGQLRSNKLALATAAIFLTCGIHHGGDALELITPVFGIDQLHAHGDRVGIMWQMDVWDAIGAVAAVFYLSLRRSYGRLLDRPEMFENPERRRYEERLEHEQISLAEAQALARLGSWEIELATQTRSWSAQMYQMMNLPVTADLSDVTIAGLADVADRARVDAAVRRSLSTNSEFEVQFRRTVDGQTRHLKTLGRVILGHDGTPVRMVGTTQDVTDVTVAAIERAAAEEQLRVTIAHAPIGVALVDLSEEHRGRLVSGNAALASIVGHPQAALAEMALGSLVHPDDLKRLNDELDRLVRKPSIRVEIEVRVLHATGDPVWVLLAGSSIPGGDRVQGVFHLTDIGERKRFEGQLQYLADHDALTGLFNRRRFEQELGRMLAEADRYRRRGAVLLLDLDGFKFVNDTLGHSAGDELVTRIGGALRGALRDTDVIGRLGGDEFAIILCEVDEPQARLVAEKLLAVCRDRTVVGVHHQHRGRVTASIGITVIDPAVAITAEELLVEADIAMYDAKEAGKDRAAAYERDVTKPLLARGSAIDRLRHATAEGRLELYAQPIVAICGDGIERYELLVRLRGDDGELIPPGTFLYEAERSDLIQDIDRWVFAQAVELLDCHTRAGHELSLNVNLSARTLTDPTLLNDLSQVLARRPVTPGQLVVEVTETAAIVNIDRAREVARGLRELGCRFALDDFGAGFASFAYLKHLDFDFLKIDGEFITSLLMNPTDRLVVRSVVDIAHALGAQTVAEFVGSEETITLLRDLGVDYGQGYHLGRPGPIPDVLPTLTRT